MAVFPSLVYDGGMVRRARWHDKLKFLTQWLRKVYTMAEVNYTPELTASMIEQYQSGISVEDIASSIDKSVRSVRSKLVREGVYVASPKAAAKKTLGPSKKELLIELEQVAPFEVDGFTGATKEAISILLNHFNEGTLDA